MTSALFLMLQPLLAFFAMNNVQIAALILAVVVVIIIIARRRAKAKK